jgi:hypothetical protein
MCLGNQKLESARRPAGHLIHVRASHPSARLRNTIYFERATTASLQIARNGRRLLVAAARMVALVNNSIARLL